MPNGTSERSALIEHCGVGGSVRKGTLYPISSYWPSVMFADRRNWHAAGAWFLRGLLQQPRLPYWRFFC